MGKRRPARDYYYRFDEFDKEKGHSWQTPVAPLAAR
jgi:hypothetical protein